MSDQHQHPQQQTGKPQETTGVALRPNSAPQLKPLTERQVLAAKAAKELIDLMGPQDVGDPKAFMVGIAAVFAKYHQAVIATAPIEIASRFNKLTLKNISDVCDELQDPISRKFERDRAATQHDNLLLEAPGKPGQDRRDEQFIDYETRIKPLMSGSMQKIERERPSPRNDGKHWDRVASDLEQRRLRNERLKAEAEAQPSSASSAA